MTFIVREPMPRFTSLAEIPRMSQIASSPHKEVRAMRRLAATSGAVLLFVLLASLSAATYEVGGPVLFALEGVFAQETIYTYTIAASPETLPADVSITAHLPMSRTWQYRRSLDVSDLDLTYAPQPDATSQQTDDLGNAFSTASWAGVSEDVTFVTQARYKEETVFEPTLTWYDKYPVEWVPEDTEVWLEPDSRGYIQSDAQEIRQLASDLAAGAVLQLEVVGRILAWVHENVRVARCDEDVEQVDALWVLENRVARCVGFSNLAVALIRATGIPAMPTSGVVADSETPDVGHAWISVYLSDLGWFEFESSSWMPQFGEVPETILTPQHITLLTGEGPGISSAPFVETHACSIDVQEKPRELQFVDTAIEPGTQVTWFLTLRSPSYYEIYQWEHGYRDVPISLSIDSVPEGWYVSLSTDEVLLKKQDLGASPSRTLMLTIVPPEDVEVGTQGVITVTARDTGSPGSPVIGVLTAAVTVTENP